MENGVLNEFNSIGAPSEEVKRKLLYLAEIGSDAVTSAFRTGPGYVSSNRKEEQDAADTQFHALAELAIVSQERIAAFQSEIDLLDEASMAALLENEEKLREAEQERERIRERAYVITNPDGSTVRVYRDGELARDGTCEHYPGTDVQ